MKSGIIIADIAGFIILVVCITIGMLFTKKRNLQPIESICLNYLRITVFVLTLLVPLNIVLYQHYTDIKHNTIDYFNSLVKYPCDYKFIKVNVQSDFTKIYTFELSYPINNISKRFVVSCPTSDSCQFPEINGKWSCYTPNTYESLNYTKPKLEYENPNIYLKYTIIVASLIVFYMLFDACFSYRRYKHQTRQDVVLRAISVVQGEPDLEGH